MTGSTEWFLAGGGEMGARMRDHDWTTSPLGHPATWSETLRNSVSLMLSSGFPTSIIWGAEHGILYNDAHRAILGAKHPTCLGLPFKTVFPETWDDIGPLIARTMGGEAIFMEDINIKLERNGFPEEAYFTFYYSPLRLADGIVGGINCGCIETTEKVLKVKQASDLLDDRSDYWNFARDMIVVIDYQGRFIDVSPAAERILGWSREEMIGRSYTGFIHPDDLTRSNDEADVVFVDGMSTDRFENRYRHKDGSYRWISWTGSSARGRFYATAQDISAGKAQTETLRLSETRASAYFDSSDDYLFLVQAGADGVVRFEDMNPACERVMGLVRGDVVGRAIDAFVPPDSAGDIIRYARLCVETRRSQTYLAPREYQDGRKVIIEGRVTFVERLGDGSGLVLFSGRDVTEQRGTEDALRQSQKMEAVGQLTGGVAHDFNNLLTVIKSSSDLLKRPNLPEERRARYVAAISDTVDRAAKLTGQLLAFARRQALKPEVFAACSSVRGLADMMRTLTGSRVQITTDLPTAPCFVNADASQFDTALVNLAVNARDAMDGEGKVTIRVQAVEAIPAIRAHARVDAPYVAVSLSDTGTGIPADMLERIFEPFFTTKEVGKGTGLGLSQVFGFAKQSGGDVTVASTPGKGTTFTLYLPRVFAPEQVKLAEELEAQVDGAGTRVLVVEDNVEVGSFTVQTLSDLGYTPVLAADGPAALAELAKDAERFDVVFSDVMMPGMSGIELGQEIRRLYHDLPVVLTSGYSHVLARNGTFGFELLHKPYSVEQLSQMLREAASRRRRRRLRGR